MSPRRKLAAYRRRIQLGLIAQGLLQIPSATEPKLVRRSFGSWIRTVRTGLAGRGHRRPEHSLGISRKCCQTLNPREIHPRQA
jgi:hypothetical protein